MICVIQRVSQASVTIRNKTRSKINNGLLLFLGVAKTDTSHDTDRLVEKILALRIMEDDAGKMNLSVRETKGEILVVSQFTLCANLKGGRRPDFFPAKEPVEAERLYNLFIEKLALQNVPVQSGEFGAEMRVNLINDGPVTFILDSVNL